eukprot:CAMPEP_0184313210 /NCGR_PEP_ID=MMETSP1049-20130417/60408_1 /TAXON_ID=77928 /ORGANISM="Proteomonas sulcata, Strain CCMP704" /LENGTH=103 /DNA_ID=CAMNT_0026630189 /DNA_START=8 /DNA_END=315 /DNA_ORIENTATION=-
MDAFWKPQDKAHRGTFEKAAARETRQRERDAKFQAFRNKQAKRALKLQKREIKRETEFRTKDEQRRRKKREYKARLKEQKRAFEDPFGISAAEGAGRVVLTEA